MSICLDLCSDKIGELWTERERVRDSENYGEIAEMRERARVCDQDRERERESPQIIVWFLQPQDEVCCPTNP